MQEASIVARTRTIDVLEKVRDGRYRVSRDGAALCDQLGIPDPVAALEAAWISLGGRPKNGRPVTTSEHEKKRQHTYKRTRDNTAHHEPTAGEGGEALLAALAEAGASASGYTPRRELQYALQGREGFADPGVRSDGAWFARFCESQLTLFEGAQFRGLPMVLASHWRSFFDELLSFDDLGHRIYETGVAEIPRKNAKSHTCAAGGIAFGSPAEGEGAPDIVLASGTAKQAGEVFTPAVTFIRKSEILAMTFKPFLSAITCPANDGSIYRIAADGDTQYGQGPYVTLADELHVWTQPKQVSLWAALRSAHGAREDFLDIVISTAGSDPESILGGMRKYAKEHPLCEKRPDMGGGGFILRDKQAKILFHAYEVAPETPLDDLPAWKAANPATWRTPERIAADLADPYLDEPSKRRQYGDEWTSAESRWISVDQWRDALDKLAHPRPDGTPDEFMPRGVDIHVGVDAAISHDCIAAAWAWRAPDSSIHVRVHVWSVRPNVSHHSFVPGGRMIGEDTAEPFVRDVLAKNYRVRSVAYDPRYFETEATHLRSGRATRGGSAAGVRRNAERALALVQLDRRASHPARR